MRLPVVTGLIKRRLLVNFRADPHTVQRLLPSPFRPALHRGHAIVGICLIRLEREGPIGIGGMFGISSENAAHRFAVEWTDSSGSEKRGVFIPRRDTNSVFNVFAGGRLFPGEQHAATFSITDCGGHIEFSMCSRDDKVSVSLIADEAAALPDSSCFRSLDEASSFFEEGDLGYSPTRNDRKFDGLRLHTTEWQTSPLNVHEVHSSYFEDVASFPEGTVAFDHALLMRNIAHEWHQVTDRITGDPKARLAEC